MNAVAEQHSASGTQPLLLSLLRLRSWPDLPQLPPEDVVDLARVCALLSWRATAGVIIARILDLPKERVQDLLSRLNAQGCLQLVAQGSATASATAEPVSVHDSVEPPAPSFITRVWQRLAVRT